MDVTINATGGLIFAVAVGNSNRIIGVTGLSQHWTLLYMFHPDFWNKGYCTESVRCFLDYLSKQQPERREITAWVFQDNIASQRVLEKCRFVAQDASRKDGLTQSMPGITPDGLPVHQQRRILGDDEEQNLRLAIEELFRGSRKSNAIPAAPSRRLLVYKHIYQSEPSHSLASI
jgi:hypothetical protein